MILTISSVDMSMICAWRMHEWNVFQNQQVICSVNNCDQWPAKTCIIGTLILSVFNTETCLGFVLFVVDNFQFVTDLSLANLT